LAVSVMTLSSFFGSAAAAKMHYHVTVSPADLTAVVSYQVSSGACRRTITSTPIRNERTADWL